MRSKCYGTSPMCTWFSTISGFFIMIYYKNLSECCYFFLSFHLRYLWHDYVNKLNIIKDIKSSG